MKTTLTTGEGAPNPATDSASLPNPATDSASLPNPATDSAYLPNPATDSASVPNATPDSAHEAALTRLAIRELVENWALWRDAGDWVRFRSVWHDDGRMMATWFQGSADEFIRVTREGWDKGVSILHFLGGSSIDLAGARAIAETKMTISQRGQCDGVLCDVVCTGRFYDFIEQRNGRWGFVLRQPIYEKDRIDPVDPSARLELERAVLDQFPEGYRHLAYIQTRIGYQVKRDMPGLKGDAVQALYARGRRWLEGGDIQA